jgi:hypothetical protein
MRFRCAPILAFVCVPAFSAHAQARTEIIRGQVKTDSGKVVVAADIIVTMAPNREIFRAASDSTGSYRLTIDKGTGDYLVYIGAAGRRSFRKRVIRAGNDSIYVVDATLAKEVTAIAAVRTTVQRTRPRRDDDAPSQVGGIVTQFGGVVGALSPDQMGDFNAMASTIPGVALTPDGGISVLGVDPSQNRVTLNGMSFDGASLPRDLSVRTTVATSLFDPTIGGFGGALIATEINHGQTLTLSRGHVTLDAPQLQAADETARSLGQRYTQAAASVARSGELSQELWVYNAAIQVTRKSSPAPSLSTADAAALQRLGVSGDSASRLIAILGNQGAPFRASGIGSDVTSTNVNAAFRLDRGPVSLFGFTSDTSTRLSISGVGTYFQSGPQGGGALSASSSDSRGTSGSIWLQAALSQYLGKHADYLSETKTAVSYRDQRTTPYLAAPSGLVLVTSDLEDGTSAAGYLRFGGSSGQVHSASWRWEGSNELSFSLADAPAHRLKVFTQAQLDGYSNSPTKSFGTFSYNSLNDLQANSPAAYSRTLFSPDRTGGEGSGSFAIADYWTKTPNLSFVFGPRLEWDAFTKSPADNPDIQRIFGGRNSAAPNGFHISPRAGFSWLYHGRQRGLISAGSQLANVFVPTRGVLRGGIGEFRSQYRPTLLSSAITETGLSGSGATRISCVGSAVPTPNWPAYLSNPASVPSTCANGTNAPSFTDAAPSVELFDPTYNAARRWTANLNWTASVDWLVYSLDAVYSMNVDQPGFVDLNYTGRQQFALTNETSRPVFVAPTSIVSSSGLVSPLDARVSQSFGSVISHRSDVRSNVGQGTLYLMPLLPQKLSSWFVSGSYTYSASRSLSNGFTDNTFGDPRLRDWSSNAGPAHIVKFQAGYRFKPLNATLTTFWGLQSGYAYTPTVASDINGDGFANDRAFIYDPASAPPAVASGMRDLLSSTSREARACLERQHGAVAQRNSCRRPWSATMNARLNWLHEFGDRWHNISGSINFSNPLAGVDQLLHGSNNLRGWGLSAMPDQRLYFVRGFDQSTKEFIYQVNPVFGKTRPELSALMNPFRVTLEINFALNGNVQRQQTDQLLRPTRAAPGARPPADTILKRLRSTGVSPASPLYWTINNADSLLLSAEQVGAVNAAAEHERVTIDSIYKSLATDLSNAPSKYDADVVSQRIQAANREIFSSKRAADALRSILTPIQLRLVPPGLLDGSGPTPPRR